ncbi:hypothetical protein ACH47Z_41460 [Streptomyces sp. NPDC020192]|uniref:hypothetical protein n=1 Tax=Streptomyces sp. NPDC020192 TaxID=3365066 RepID=UPI00379F50DC
MSSEIADVPDPDQFLAQVGAVPRWLDRVEDLTSRSPIRLALEALERGLAVHMGRVKGLHKASP